MNNIIKTLNDNTTYNKTSNMVNWLCKQRNTVQLITNNTYHSYRVTYLLTSNSYLLKYIIISDFIQDINHDYLYFIYFM